MTAMLVALGLVLIGALASLAAAVAYMPRHAAEPARYEDGSDGWEIW